MTPTKTCEWCASPLPPGRGGPRARRFCGDVCRKRQARAREIVSPPPSVADGPVAAAIRAVLAEVGLDAVGTARGEMAVALARLVDAGSVPAARELRPLLGEIDLIEDVEAQQFLASVRTPGIGPRTDPG